jgi:hypothetical protein
VRIVIVAPPWVAVPPPAYGGTEAVLDTLAPDTYGLAAAIGRVGDVDRHACRRVVKERFSMTRLAEDHLRLYERVLAARQVQLQATAA